jgi:ElaB/YqjD/DUF883 family membrane-anchored ribosome-binding protein
MRQNINMSPEQGSPTASSESIHNEIERQRQSSARLLDNFAAKLGAVASRGGRTAGGAVRYAADNVQRAAHYVQGDSLKETAREIERFIRRRPAPSLIVAAAAGFLLGRALGSRRGS